MRLDENLHITHMDDKLVFFFQFYVINLIIKPNRLQRTLNWNVTHATSSLYLYIHPDDLPSLIAIHRDCK